VESRRVNKTSLQIILAMKRNSIGKVMSYLCMFEEFEDFCVSTVYRSNSDAKLDTNENLP